MKGLCSILIIICATAYISAMEEEQKKCLLSTSSDNLPGDSENYGHGSSYKGSQFNASHYRDDDSASSHSGGSSFTDPWFSFSPPRDPRSLKERSDSDGSHGSSSYKKKLRDSLTPIFQRAKRKSGNNDDDGQHPRQVLWCQNSPSKDSRTPLSAVLQTMEDKSGDASSFEFSCNFNFLTGLNKASEDAQKSWLAKAESKILLTLCKNMDAEKMVEISQLWALFVQEMSNRGTENMQVVDNLIENYNQLYYTDMDKSALQELQKTMMTTALNPPQGYNRLYDEWSTFGKINTASRLISTHSMEQLLEEYTQNTTDYVKVLRLCGKVPKYGRQYIDMRGYLLKIVQKDLEKKQLWLQGQRCLWCTRYSAAPAVGMMVVAATYYVMMREGGDSITQSYIIIPVAFAAGGIATILVLCCCIKFVPAVNKKIKKAENIAEWLTHAATEHTFLYVPSLLAGVPDGYFGDSSSEGEGGEGYIGV